MKDSIDEVKQEDSERARILPIIADSDSMLNSDMGVWGFLYIINDLCYVSSSTIDLQGWQIDELDPSLSDESITEAITSLSHNAMGNFLESIALALGSYDWRASKADGLTEEERQSKIRFRGSTGYRQLREDLLFYLVEAEDDDVVEAAVDVFSTLGYER